MTKDQENSAESHFNQIDLFYFPKTEMGSEISELPGVADLCQGKIDRPCSNSPDIYESQMNGELDLHSLDVSFFVR